MARYKKQTNYDNVVKRRFTIFLVVLVSLFSVVFVKLVKVMILDNKKYNESLVALTSTQVTLSSSPRGRILDRNYNVIVDNKASKSIVYKKKKNIKNSEMISLAYEVGPHITLDLSKLTLRSKKEFFLAKYPDICNKKVTDYERELVKQRKMTNRELEELKIKRITDEDLSSFQEEDLKAAYLFYLMNKGYTYEEKTIKSDVSDSEYAYISENNDKLEGFDTRLDWERVYPYGDVMKTILGTVSSTSSGLPKEEKDYYLEKGYALNERVGLSYLEKEYEEYLHGERSIYEVVNSNELRLVKEGSRGKDIVLTIDINLQREVEKAIREQITRAKGEYNTEYYDHSSVIIQDPNTGEILAMASKRIVNGNIVDNTNNILISPIMPGSVVKGASMLVGYNTGAIKIGDYMVDECITVAGTPTKCSSVTLGYINDITALAKSSNVYQFKTAIRVNGQEYYYGMKLNFNQRSFEIYRNMYHSFGLGVKTGIDLPIESSGYTSKDVAAGNLLDFVMGQYETYTPIQLSQYISTIANSGKRIQPHLLKEVHDSTYGDEVGETIYTYETKVLNTVSTEEAYMNRVKEGFYAVMHSAGGYGVGYINDRMDAAGKTGTSQSFIDTNNDGIIDTETITSSFVGYFPASNPKISIIVTSPNSSHPNSEIDYASLVTMRITRQITDSYYYMYGN